MSTLSPKECRKIGRWKYKCLCFLELFWRVLSCPHLTVKKTWSRICADLKRSQIHIISEKHQDVHNCTSNMIFKKCAHINTQICIKHEECHWESLGKGRRLGFHFELFLYNFFFFTMCMYYFYSKVPNFTSLNWKASFFIWLNRITLVIKSSFLPSHVLLTTVPLY